MASQIEHMWRGYALADKMESVITLQVLVPELLPAAIGDNFAAGRSTATSSFTDMSGTDQATQLTTANHVVAVWYGDHNQTKAPMVKAGEQVTVFKLKGVDKIYWQPTSRSLEARTTDVHRIEIAANDQRNTTKDDSGVYFFEMNSMDKSLAMGTSSSNGEMFAYRFKMDSMSGNLVISDDNKAKSQSGAVVGNTQTGAATTPHPKAGMDQIANSFVINSVTNTVSICSGQKAVVSVVGERVILHAPKDMIIRADRQILIDTPCLTIGDTYKDTNVTVFSGKSLGYNFTDIVANATSYGVNAAAKFSNVLVAKDLRFETSYYGTVGDAYVAATTSTATGVGSPNTNTPDTTLYNGEVHTVVAYDKFIEYAQSVADQFTEVKGSKAGAPSNPSSSLAVAKTTEITTIKGMQ